MADAKMNREEMLSLLVDCFAYGVVKAEKDLMGNSTVYSRKVGDYLAQYWIDGLKKAGIELKPSNSPKEAVTNYIENLGAAGLANPSQFVIEEQGTALQVKALKCPYGRACKALMAEKIDDFACLRAAFLGYAIFNGTKKRARYKAKPDPGAECIVTLEMDVVK
jgi:hypothetical protein